MRYGITTLKWLASRALFLKRWLYSIRDAMMYTKASLAFYKTRAIQPNTIQHTQYYNTLGRVIFGAKELLALLSNGKIFKKSLQLEGFDEIDYLRLYEKGSQDILWPKSPFVELAPSSLRDSDIEAIATSYFASYHDSGMAYGEYAKVFQAYFCKQNGTFSKEKLANFRMDSSLHTVTDSQMLKKLNLSFILSDHLSVLNRQQGYVKSYLKSLDLILDYHRFSDIIDHDILGSISESFAGNIQTPSYRGQRVSPRLLYLASVVSQIRKHIPFDTSHRNVIVDIGGGFGHLGRLTHYYVPNSCYILVELEEMICYGAYFLKYAFQDKKIALYEDIKDSIDEEFEALTNEYDFIILPAWKYHDLPSESVDLYVTTTSVSELPESIAKAYVETMDRTLKYGGHIYTHTKLEIESHTPDTYPHYAWNFKSDYLTISYHYYPINWVENSSPQWIGKKVK